MGGGAFRFLNDEYMKAEEYGVVLHDLWTYLLFP